MTDQGRDRTLREKIAAEIDPSAWELNFFERKDEALNTADRILALIQAEHLRLADLLESAAEDILAWAGYASAYFQEKHGLADDVEKYRSAAKAIGCER